MVAAVQHNPGNHTDRTMLSIGELNHPQLDVDQLATSVQTLMARGRRNRLRFLFATVVFLAPSSCFFAGGAHRRPPVAARSWRVGR